jgi:hypothetical protein
VTETDSDYNEDLLNTFMKSKSPSQSTKSNKHSNDLSATSPFITSDVFNYLNNTQDSATSIQAGGATSGATSGAMTGGGKKKKKTKHLSNMLDDDSSTSLTSSESVSSTDDFSSTGDMPKKKTSQRKEKTTQREKSQRNTRSTKKDKKEMRGNDMSYNSSSAHTGGEFSNTETNAASVTNENNDNGIVSINTSDINMVSEY